MRKPSLRLDLGHRGRGLAGDQDGGGDLALLERLERIGLAHVHFLGLDAEPLEDVAGRQLRAASRCRRS